MVYHHHRPLTGIYSDNYRYGTSLYSPSAMDVEKNYRNSLAKTHLRSDRGDLGLYSFAGSHLHGGTPAADRGAGPKGSLRSPNSDLYSPLNTAGYGPGYYDHLRATDRDPRPRSRHDYLSDEPSDLKSGVAWVPSSYQTGPSKFPSTTSYEFDDDLNRKTTKTTKTTEYWVPLTTHIYNTPYHTYYYRATPHSSYTYRTADDLYSYNYVDDYKRYATTTTTKRSKNIDALDLSITSKNYEKMDYSNYVSKW